MWRRMVLKFIIKAIKKYFSEGISVITNKEETIIAYKWVWSKEIDDMCGGKKVWKD